MLFKNWKKTVLLFFVIFFVSGICINNACFAAGNTSDDKELTLLKNKIEQNPNDINALLDLGLAFYEKLEFDSAIATLKRVLELEPNNGKALFYTGTAYEINGDLDNAINMYKQYNLVNKSSGIRNDLEKRLQKLIHIQMRQQIQQTLAEEQALEVSQIPENTLAVVYFKYMGKDENLQPLQKGLADLLITDLSKVEKLSVIERLKMQALLEEMGLGMTGLVDAQTAPRVGKLLGSAKLINGAFIDLDKDQFRIDAGITETSSGEFKSSDVSGKLNKFFKLEKDLVFNLAKTLGFKLTQKEIDNIRMVPTENLLAFMAYCNALDYSDRGMYEQAGQEYSKALQIDPNFELAKQKQQQLPGLSESLQPVNQLVEFAETEFTQQPAAAETVPVTVQEPTTTAVAELTSPAETAGPFSQVTLSRGLAEPTFMDRLQNTGQIIDIGFIPGVESREPVQEQSQPTFGNTANIEIRVPIQ